MMDCAIIIPRVESAIYQGTPEFLCGDILYFLFRRVRGNAARNRLETATSLRSHADPDTPHEQGAAAVQ